MSSLRNKSLFALFWESVGKLSTHGVTFIISIVLARLLTPTEFGLIGIALALINISQSLFDIGFKTALIQNKDNDAITYSSVFILNIFLGLLVFSAFQLIATPLAIFFEQSELDSVIKWLSIGLIFNSFNLVQVAILTRHLKFKELNIRIFIAGLTSGLIAVFLAFKGFGVYALVFQNVFSQLIGTIIIWQLSDWRPNWSFKWMSIKQLSSFSVYYFLSQIGHQLILNSTILIVGKLFSPITLGFYSRANSLRSLVINYSSGTLGTVFFPILSQLQNNLSRFQQVYLKVISFTSFLSFFLSGLLIVSAEVLILILFGEKWRPTIVIFQTIMFALFNYPINSIIVNSFLALGKAKENFWYGNVRKLLRIIPIIVAYYYGFESFLISMVVISMIGTIFNNIISAKVNKINLWTQTLAIYRYGFAFVISMAVIYLVNLFTSFNLYLMTFLNLLIFSCFYFVVVFLVDKQIFKEIKELNRKRKVYLRLSNNFTKLS